MFASAAIAVCLAACAAGCRVGASAMAERIVARYHSVSGAKPLPSRGMIRLDLRAAPGHPQAAGSLQIEWSPYRYRETASSAGLTTVRGIESGKAYFTDEDGVTRVASEPILRELATRAYFWRRAWLFDDRDGALIALGPADDRVSSVVLSPAGANALTLRFSRQNGSLLEVSSPRFALRFDSPTSVLEASRPDRAFAATIAWTGLPTAEIAHAEVGGGSARFGRDAPPIAWTRAGGTLLVPARIGGTPVTLAVDAAVDGPLRLSPGLAARLPLRFADDVFGRRVAKGASLELGGAAYPAISAAIAEAIPGGADAAAGGCLYREAVLELDPAHRTLALHDPAQWSPPEGFFRTVIDDDGNKPVAILRNGSRELRLAEGSDARGAALRLAEASAARAGLGSTQVASGLNWGPQDLPPLTIEIVRGEFAPEWGDDGRMGWDALAPFHVFIDMPRRWTYLRPAEK